jgi:hypothetical protein
MVRKKREDPSKLLRQEVNTNIANAMDHIISAEVACKDLLEVYRNLTAMVKADSFVNYALKAKEEIEREIAQALRELRRSRRLTNGESPEEIKDHIETLEGASSIIGFIVDSTKQMADRREDTGVNTLKEIKEELTRTGEHTIFTEGYINELERMVNRVSTTRRLLRDILAQPSGKSKNK